MSDELITHLSRFRRRLRLRDGWLLAQRSLWLAALASALVLAAGRLFPIQYWKEIALAPAGIWLLVVLAYSLFRPLPPMRVARRVDGELGLKERLSTSLALEAGGDRLPERLRASFQPDLVDRQQHDALSAARGVHPRQAFPLRWLRRPTLTALGLAAVALALVFLPNPMEKVLAERAAVRQEARQQAQKVEQIQKQVQESQELTPEERAALLKKLEELAKQLKENPGDREKALADLAKAEEALREQLKPDTAARQAALEAMAAQLQALSQSEGKATDLARASEDLKKLAEEMKSMSEAERQALAQQLAQMAARAGQAGEAELAQALAQMATAAQGGDFNQASIAAANGARAMQSAQRQLSAQAKLQQALSQLQGSRQAMSQAGQQGQQAQNPGQGNQPGQGSQPGQGNQPGGGGGSNANVLPPFQGGKMQVKPPQGSKTGSTGADVGNQVYVPREKGGGNKEVFIPGQETGQGTTQEKQTKDPLPGSLNPALVPYTSVYQTYLEAANQAIEESYIPSGLKDYVKGYFEGLGQ